MFDACIAAAGIDAPPDDRTPPEGFARTTSAGLDLDAAGVSAVVWRPATGSTSAGWISPCWTSGRYPRHVRGVTTYPGLYAVGLPWLHSEPSSVFVGVGADAAHIVEHIAARRRCLPGRATAAAPSQLHRSASATPGR